MGLKEEDRHWRITAFGPRADLTLPNRTKRNR